MPEVMWPVSTEFFDAMSKAVGAARGSYDECVRYAAQTVPVYAQPRPTTQQARAAGCLHCMYLGLWADRWPKYEDSPHGIIWVFEEGIRTIAARNGNALTTECLSVLLHEIDHALQRDHILQAVEQQQRVAAMTGGLFHARP